MLGPAWGHPRRLLTSTSPPQRSGVAQREVKVPANLDVGPLGNVPPDRVFIHVPRSKDTGDVCTVFDESQDRITQHS